MAHKLYVNPIANVAALNATTSYQFKADYFQVISVQAVWTVTAASATVTLQLSNDGVTWDNFATATAVTASGNVSWYLLGKDALYVRVLYTQTSGQADTFKVYMSNTTR
jgi:hypothetical protein